MSVKHFRVNITPEELEDIGAAIRIKILSINNVEVNEEGWTLLDTGAQISHVRKEAIDKYNIPPLDKPPILCRGFTPDGEKKLTPMESYSIKYSIPEISNHSRVLVVLKDDNIEEHKYKGEPLIAILGRDFLSDCNFTYNGRTGIFEISIE